MCALVFRPIWRVAERLVTSVMLTDVRPFSGVWAHVKLEVPKTRERLVTSLVLQTTNSLQMTKRRSLCSERDVIQCNPLTLASTCTAATLRTLPSSLGVFLRQYFFSVHGKLLLLQMVYYINCYFAYWLTYLLTYLFTSLHPYICTSLLPSSFLPYLLACLLTYLLT